MEQLTFLPDILLLVTAIVVLLVDARQKKEEGIGPLPIAMGGSLLVLVSLFLNWPESTETWLTYEATSNGFWWRVIFVLALLGVQWLSRNYFQITGMGNRAILNRPGAFHALLLFCTFGMFVLVSSQDLLTFFIGLELATLPLFALVGFQSRSGGSVEAASKLMVLAGMATALNLFGISFLFGACGSLRFDILIAAALHPTPLLHLGALLVFGGLGFKLAVVPFQMWAPDVYEGAPTPVTAFLSVGSKAAGLAAMATVFFGPLDGLRRGLYPLFAIVAIASMIAGNLGAMRQENLRRFLAYSSIAQAGGFMLAFTGDGTRGLSALLFNLFVYGAANLTFFFTLNSLGGRPEEMFSFRGLSKEKPVLAVVLLLTMFSLAGIPPLAGFLGKFQLFSVAIGSHHYVLVLLALANAVWALYYYLRPVREAYAMEEGFAQTRLSKLGWGISLPLGMLSVMLVVLGVFPRLLEWLP